MGEWEEAFAEIESILKKKAKDLDVKFLKSKDEWSEKISSYVDDFSNASGHSFQNVFGDSFRFLTFSYWSQFHENKLKTGIFSRKASARGIELSDWYNNALKEQDASEIAIYELFCKSEQVEKNLPTICIANSPSDFDGPVINTSDFIDALHKIKNENDECFWDIGYKIVESEDSTNFHQKFSQLVYKPLVNILESSSPDGDLLKSSMHSFQENYANIFGSYSQRKKGLVESASLHQLLPVILLCAFFDLDKNSRMFCYLSFLPLGVTSSGMFVGFNRDITKQENTMVQALVNEICWFPALIENQGIQTRQNEKALKNATRAAVTALDGRNLSHNLGSHVLRWMEQESRELAQNLIEAQEKHDFLINTNPELTQLLVELTNSLYSREDLYCHLRERMDLLAATAVHLPMWTANTSIKTLVKELKAAELKEKDLGRFKESKEKDSSILRHIGHSEGVFYTDVVFSGQDTEIAVPGSLMGEQAFYGILENIARDAAKYSELCSDGLVLIKSSEELNKWEYEQKFGNFELFYLDSNSRDVKNKRKFKEILKEKFSDSSIKNLLVVVVTEDETICSASRDLQNEKDTDFTIWQVKMLKNCHHQLCQTIRDLDNSLKDTNEENFYEKKAKSLVRALLSINVQVSEVSDMNLTNVNKESHKREIKDNLLRVVVYDDRGLFIHSGEEIRKKIRVVEESGLCNEEGMLLPDNWGIKERYIFAAYLRGKSPHTLLLPTIIQTESINPPILDVEDHQGRLAWVFYMLKPKDILIISNTFRQTDIPANQQERINVWSWQEFKQSRDSSSLRHKFVVLDFESKSNSIELDEIEKELDYLPYRVFVYNPTGNSSYIATNHCVELDNLDLSDLSFRKLYQKWIEFIALRNKQPLPKIVSVSGGFYHFDECYVNGSFLGTIEEGGKNAEGKNFSWDNLSNVALFDRHGSLLKRVRDQLGSKVIHYEPYEGGWSVSYRADFAGSEDLRGDKYFELKDSLQEAALIRILVVDERIDGSLDQIQENFGREKLTLRELWRYKGVEVIGREYKGKGYDTPDENEIFDCLVQARKEGYAYHFILLHQGILDKLYERKKRTENKREFTDFLIKKLRHEYKVWNTLIHSGRGGIPDLSTGTKFIHLSSVEGWFGSNISKMEIVEELMSVRNEK